MGPGISNLLRPIFRGPEEDDTRFLVLLHASQNAPENFRWIVDNWKEISIRLKKEKRIRQRALAENDDDGGGGGGGGGGGEGGEEEEKRRRIREEDEQDRLPPTGSFDSNAVLSVYIMGTTNWEGVPEFNIPASKLPTILVCGKRSGAGSVEGVTEQPAAAAAATTTIAIGGGGGGGAAMVLTAGGGGGGGEEEVATPLLRPIFKVIEEADKLTLEETIELILEAYHDDCNLDPSVAPSDAAQIEKQAEKEWFSQTLEQYFAEIGLWGGLLVKPAQK